MNKKIYIVIYAVVLISIVFFFSCEKDKTPPFYNAISCFEISSGIFYMDSVVNFINCSDSVNVNYLWDFGDGVCSKERTPNHVYTNPGKYNIKLTTYVNNIPTDTIIKEIKVLIGERYIDYQYSINQGIDFAELPDSTILLLGLTRDYQNYNSYKVFISKFDKNLKQRWLKILNSNSGNIENTSDGNLIISGSYDNSTNDNHFALIKIDTSGNVIWRKKYPETNGWNNYVIESKDRGFISMGQENFYDSISGMPYNRVTVLKTDANGNFIWKRCFKDQGLWDAENIISIDDCFIFASSKYGKGGYYAFSDSLVLTKLSNTGEVIWEKSKEWQIPNSSIIYNVFSTKISANDDVIIAINTGNTFVMSFNKNGDFIERNYSDLYMSNTFICKTNNNNFIIGGGRNPWATIILNGFDNKGEKLWSESYGNRNIREFPAYGFGTIAKPLRDGNILFLGSSYKESTDRQKSSMLIVKINENGEIQ